MEEEDLKTITTTTTKRIKSVQDKEEEEDRISSLPDCLLIDILSRLDDTKQAFETSVLSKRWKSIWTSVTTLTFHDKSDKGISKLGNCSRSKIFFSLVDKTLTQCGPRLYRYETDNRYYRQSQSESQVYDLIRVAINRNVQQLDLLLHKVPDRFVLKDELFFNNSCFAYLEFEYCKFNPNGAVSWKNLKSLRILDAMLDEDVIQNILSGSPLLETLELIDCYGFKRLDITSKSVKNLFFVGYNHSDFIQINAPYVLSLTIRRKYLNWLKNLLLLDVSSLVKVNLGCFLPTDPYDEAEEDMLKRFILKCSHVNEFIVGDYCSKVLSCLKAKGFIYPPDIKFPES